MLTVDTFESRHQLSIQSFFLGMQALSCCGSEAQERPDEIDVFWDRQPVKFAQQW